MKRLMMLCVMAALLFVSRQAQADTTQGDEKLPEQPVIEVMRGEEAEAELTLPGTEEMYSVYGVLTGDGTYALLLEHGKQPEYGYQAVSVQENGAQAKLLLSRLGNGYHGGGLKVRLRVEGKRIGTQVLTLQDAVFVSEEAAWLTGTAFPEIRVNVLPNPVVISVSGKGGNGEWFLGEAEVSIKDKDAEEIYYSLDGMIEEVYEKPFVLKDGIWMVQVRTDDGYGYIKNEQKEVLVDGKKPELAVSLTETDWQSGPVGLSFAAADAVSGVEEAGWALTESMETPSAWQSLEGEQEHTIGEDGIYYLHLWGRDVAGNEATAVFGPYKKDSVAPQIRFANVSQKENKVNRVTPEITIEDYSGIQTTEYYLDGTVWEPSEITGKGAHTLTVAATDLAGNRAEETVEFYIYDALTLSCSAKDTGYSETGMLCASVSYAGEVLVQREVTFYVNGEEAGTAVTDRHGTAVFFWPVWLAPQEATVTAVVAQDDTLYYAETKAECTFTVEPEHAVAVYTGDMIVENGETFFLRLETAELPDEREGDITKAVFHVTLSYIEEDGSRSIADEWELSPDLSGTVEWNGTYETGLYELTVDDAEGSFYTGNPLKLWLTVYDIEAEYEDGTGSLLIDLPNVGLKITAELALTPVPDIDVEAVLRIPGTGIVLTENDITGCNLTTEGLKLTGKAQHPKTGETYHYEMKAELGEGIVITGLEAVVYEGDTASGEEKGEPVYDFRWSLEDMSK